MSDTAEKSKAEMEGRTRTYLLPFEHGEPAFEYLLPLKAEEMRKEHQEILTPWSERFLDLPIEEAAMVLANDWNGLSSNASIVASELSRFKPRSLYFDCGNIFLGLQDGDQFLLLGEPLHLGEDQITFLRSFGVEGLDNFFHHFHRVHLGLSTYTFRLGSTPNPVTRMEYQNLGEWEGGVEVFNSLADSVYILGIDGTVGRWDSTNLAVEKAEDSLGSFLRRIGKSEYF